MQNDVTKTSLSNCPIKQSRMKNENAFIIYENAFIIYENAFDVICRRLICQEGDLNRFISLEKEVMDNMAKNLKQQTLESFFKLQNKCLITEIE